MQKGKAAREEREKNQHLKENARLELLLHKELGSKDLSVIAKKLGATSKVCSLAESANISLQFFASGNSSTAEFCCNSTEHDLFSRCQ